MGLLSSFNTGYVKASSMTESVLATAIISICMLLAVKIYALVLNETISDVALQGKQRVDELMQTVKLNQDFEPADFEYERFTIRKRVSSFEGSSNLREVRFLVKGERDSLVYKFLISSNDGE